MHPTIYDKAVLISKLVSSLEPDRKTEKVLFSYFQTAFLPDVRVIEDWLRDNPSLGNMLLAELLGRVVDLYQDVELEDDSAEDERLLTQDEKMERVSEGICRYCGYGFRVAGEKYYRCGIRDNTECPHDLVIKEIWAGS